MIRKQYRRGERGYFNNFIKVHNATMVDHLKLYKATIGKSKNMNYMINVKWHDEALYGLFVLRWT